MNCISRANSVLLLAVLSLAGTVRPAHTQTRHPTITSVTPRQPAPNELVTIRGTDLLPDTLINSQRLTWTATLQYKEKYGGSSFLEIRLSGTNSALTFSAPANMFPDSAAIVYTADQLTQSFLPIPTSERRLALGAIHVRRPPVLNRELGTAVNGRAGAFNVLVAGPALTVSGKDLLTLPAVLGSRDVSVRPVVSQLTTFAGPFTAVGSYGPPTVAFAGIATGVSNARYVPRLRDEVTFSTSAIAHNTTGYLLVRTTQGADSVNVTIVRAPQNVRVVDQTPVGIFPVTNGQLIRGRPYHIVGQNLAIKSQSSPNSFNKAEPSVRIAGVTLDLLNVVATINDTMVRFSIPLTANAITAGALSLSHAGGSASLGNFTVIDAPARLDVTGAVISPNDIIAGTPATLTVSVSPTPTNFTTAGSLIVTIPASLAAVIAPIAPIQITSNPMIVTVPTLVAQATQSGTLQIGHSARLGTSASLAVSVRPPRPIAIAVATDTVAGGNTVTGTVSFDLAGPATILLSSSDPSVAAVQASAVRTGSTAAFTVTTQSVTTPRSATIFAALNGVTTSRTVVVRPGRLQSVTVAPTSLFGGEPGNATVLFDIPVSAAPVTLASSDTALRFSNLGSGIAAVTGTSRHLGFTTSSSLARTVTATVTATADGVARTATVQVNPIQLAAFTVAPASGVGGANLAATLRLSRTALVEGRVVKLRSSDTTVATVQGSAPMPVGTDARVVAITLRPGTGTRTATITADVMTSNSPTAVVVNSRSVTVTVTP